MKKIWLCLIPFAVTLLFYFSASYNIYLDGSLQNFDYGILFQSLSLFAEGKPLLLYNRGVHVLADNQEYLQFLWAPLTWFSNPHAAVLLAHAFFLALPGLIILLISWKENKKIIGACLALAYWLHPAILNMNIDAAHSEVMATSFLLVMFLGFQYKVPWLFLCGCLASCLAKEDVALTVFFLSSIFALLAWQQKSPYRLYLVGCVMAASMLILNMYILLPHFKALTAEWMGFATEKMVFRQAPVTPVMDGLLFSSNPILYILESFLRMDVAKYLLILLFPAIFLPRKSAVFLFALLPAVAILASTRIPYHIQMKYHYDYATIAVVLIAWLSALATKNSQWRVGITSIVALAFIAGLVFTETWNTSLKNYSAVGLWPMATKSPTVEFLEGLKGKLPTNIRISTDYYSLSYLIGPGRNKIYMWPNPIKTDYFGIYSEISKHPDSEVDLIILSRRSTYSEPFIEMIDANIYQPVALGPSDFVIYRNRKFSTNFLQN